jgi:UDPglucose 6-dehydrogenase
MRIAVIGLGYVGLSNAILLSVKNEVFAYDIIPQKIEMLNARKSLIVDTEIQDYLANRELNLRGVISLEKALENSSFAIIATPTDYKPELKFFDTSSVDKLLSQVIEINPAITIIIKSTVPVGYTKSKRLEFGKENIFFSPEFLREGKALYDNLYPSRIIIGGSTEEAKLFVKLLAECALKNDIDVLFTDSDEAEAVKLFSNTYLALRVSFFNELDTYAEVKSLKSMDIIKGVCLDPRIGDYYNNPSFGYGGYCLPKDTKQLLANYESIPQNLIAAIVESNSTRKEFVAARIAGMSPKIVGIYRLVMKNNSDNFRHSSILGVIEKLKKLNIEIQIYEPILKLPSYMGCKIVTDLDDFINSSSIIVANRLFKELNRVSYKVYTRDLFNRD